MAEDQFLCGDSVHEDLKKRFIKEGKRQFAAEVNRLMMSHKWTTLTETVELELSKSNEVL